MTTPLTPARSGQDIARWTIYGLLSVLTMTFGIVCLVADWSDVGISLLSGGITSALFLVQKVVDDISQGDERKAQALVLQQMIANGNAMGDKVQLAVAKTFAEVGQGADQRVAASRHLTAESSQLIAQVSESSVLEVDGIGISLKQMFLDHEPTFRETHLLNVRLILLDPESAMFDPSVRQEGRDSEVMRAQLAYAMGAAARIAKARKLKGWDAGIEVRLLDGIMTVTGLRVNSTWLFRPRMANESNNFQFFFERYGPTAPECFKMVCTHFESLWELGMPALLEGDVATHHRVPAGD